MLKIAMTLTVSMFMFTLTCCSALNGSNNFMQQVQVDDNESTGIPQTYSNSNLNGTYSLLLANPTVNANVIGYFVANGKGSITSGTVTLNITGNGGNCTATVKGNYSLLSSASGTATFNFSSGGSKPCTKAQLSDTPDLALPVSFLIQAGSGGSSVLFADTNAEQGLNGQAVLQ